MRPQPLTQTELLAKLGHLDDVLASHGYQAVVLHSEGAMRWLTGMRHQVVDIDPHAPSTVRALVESGKPRTITFFSDPWEQARIADMMRHDIWGECAVLVHRSVGTPKSDKRTLVVEDSAYAEIERAIVSPLVEGRQGNQWEKLTWLVAQSRQALIEIAGDLRVGMNGWQVRSLIYEAYHRRHLELNLVMVGLAGMEHHLHPVVEDESIIERGTIVKLVIGSRYYDMFHSASQLVCIGRPLSDREGQVHHALQDAGLRYARTFEAGAVEADLHASLAAIFAAVERDHAIDGFAASAYLHHCGGPLSPLGNRDFVITASGKRPLLPNAQFAINPVDALEHLKFELQGISLEGQPPMIIDEFAWTDDRRLFSVMDYEGSPIKLPTILTVDGGCNG